MLLLAEIATIAGLPGEAVTLLTKASTLLPEHRETLTKLAELRVRQCQFKAALELLAGLVTADPDDLRAATIQLSLLTQIGRYEEAEQSFKSLIASHPGNPRLPLGYGHFLRTLGRTEESAALYRTTLRQAPAVGEAWWGLADLKSGALQADDIATLERLLGNGGLDINQALHLSFALGKAQEDARTTRHLSAPTIRPIALRAGQALSSGCDR